MTTYVFNLKLCLMQGWTLDPIWRYGFAHTIHCRGTVSQEFWWANSGTGWTGNNLVQHLWWFFKLLASLSRFNNCVNS